MRFVLFAPAFFAAGIGTVASATATASVSACPVQGATRVAPTASAATEKGRWEDEIAAFEASDRTDPPQPGGVLFVGSSSIRMWPHLSSYFPGVNVVQRGFGGSELWEVVNYAPRIVLPYCPRLIVLYAGDNDIAAGRSPDSILSDYKKFVSLVEGSLPKTRIVFVSIKPSGSRWALADSMRAANDLVRRFTATDPRLKYVDVFTPMLGPDGLPRDDLFLDDKLHMTPAGYAIWQHLLAPIVSGKKP